MGDVSQAVVPKVSLVSSPRNGGTLCTRNLIPVRCHDVDRCFRCGFDRHRLHIARFSGSCAGHASCGKGQASRDRAPNRFVCRAPGGRGHQEKPIVERAGLVRTARAIFDGIVFPRSRHANDEAEAG